MTRIHCMEGYILALEVIFKDVIDLFYLGEEAIHLNILP